MSDSAKKYLDLIAEHLQENHAAVLVGAGFSRNADKLDPDGPNSPLWMDLARAFQDRLGYSDQQRAENMDPLRLADYVEISYGRPELDQLLIKCVHDEDFRPSKLHIDLMRLPWTDVFTTNYDTLLERAAGELVDKKFKTVLQKEDLVGSAGVTRIIKLHGSFPSARPFIISSEDYRTYPRKYAPFLNTVQQSLLENTLCLIGFSGTDPNFQQWIGWIRDNLGKQNSPFIYLLQHGAASDAENRWMLERNIVPVNLSELCKDKSPRKIYQRAIDYLTQKLNEGNRLEINLAFVEPKWDPDVRFPDLNESPGLTDEALKKLRQLHASYPGWLIPPQPKIAMMQDLVRFQHYHGLDYFAKNKLAETHEILRAVEYLYEYDWMRDTALLPLLRSERIIYQKILQQIPENIKELLSDEQTEQLQKYWVSVQISILRSLRQDSAWDEWMALYATLMKKIDLIQGEQIQRIIWEECLCARDRYDFELLEKRLQAWKVPSNSSKWVLRRGGLLAECGSLHEAEESIKDALHWIRLLPQEKQLQLEIASVESPLMLLRDYVEQAIKNSPEHWNKHFDETKVLPDKSREMQRLGFSAISAYQGELKEENGDSHKQQDDKDDTRRKIKHSHYRVSWEEQNEWFVRRLPELWRPYSESRTERTFDFGGKSVSHFWGSDEEALTAFAFLDFREKTGMPFYLNSIDCDKKAACYAAERIARYQPLRSILTVVQADEPNKITAVLTRGILSCWTRQETDEQSSFFRKAVERTMSRLTEKDWFFRRGFDRLAADVLPEVLSELCSKCSQEELERLLILIKKIYSAPNRMCYQKTASLLKRLLASWPSGRYSELVFTLLKFPFVEENDAMQNSYFSDPILLLNFNKMDHIVPELRDSIDRLFEKYTLETEKKKSWLFSRMLACLELGQLNEEQKQFLGKELWKEGAPDLPSGWSYTIRLSLPAPEPIDPIRWVCSQVTEEVQKYAEKNGYSSSDGIVLGRLSHLVSKYPEQFFTFEVSQIIAELSDRTVLLSKGIIRGYAGFLGSDEIEQQLCSVLHSLWRLTIGRREWKPTQEDTNCMRKILDEAKKCGVYHYALFTRWRVILENSQDSILNFAASMRSNKEQAWWGYHTLAQACLEPEKALLTDEEITLGVDATIQHIAWCVPARLPAALQTAKIIIENCPERISAEQRKLLSEGLCRLAYETRILGEDDVEIASYKGEKRIAAVALAKSLMSNKLEGINSEVLEQWQKIWENQDEFAEIRNA